MHRPRADEGFTLIEVLVAFVIFALTAAATVAVLITALKSVRENSDRVYAANLARGEIDRQRELGTQGIRIGQVSQEVSSAEGDFTITTTSNWVGLNQTANACDATSPGQDYMRVHVEVSGATLQAVQTADTVVAPPDDADASTTGQFAVEVMDQEAAPVSSVTVTLRNLQTAGAPQTYVTGPDGCVFIPFIVPAQRHEISIARVGYVPRVINGTIQNDQVEARQTKHVTFEYAAATTLRADTSNPDFPIPEGIPFSYGSDPLAIKSASGPWPVSVGSLWPATSGYQAWLGSCTAADPASFTAPRTSAINRTWYPSNPGGNAAVALTGITVKVRGLPEAAIVRGTTSAEPAGSCPSGATYDLGKTDAKGVLRVLLPYGQWTFQSPKGNGETYTVLLNPPCEGCPSPSPTPTPTPTIVLPPDPTNPQIVVSFTVAALDIPKPTATPTPGSSGAPTPGPS